MIVLSRHAKEAFLVGDYRITVTKVSEKELSCRVEPPIAGTKGPIKLAPGKGKALAENVEFGYVEFRQSGNRKMARIWVDAPSNVSVQRAEVADAIRTFADKPPATIA